MSRCSLLILLILATACDPPTAPQVRERIEQAQADIFSGRPMLFTEELQRTMAEALDRGGSIFPTDLLVVEGSDGTNRYLATVMERVYLPPPSSGGRPYTRRMLLAWDRESRTGIALAADDSVATVVFPSPEWRDESNPKRIWGNIGFVTLLLGDNRDAWFGGEGSVQFAAEEAIGECKFKGLGSTAGFPFTEMPTKVTETCQQVRYQVRARSVLEHRNPADSGGSLNRWIGATRSLFVRPQAIRGTRIVTQCPEPNEKTTMIPIGCGNSFNFWRGASQFAPDLGVDLSRLRPATNYPHVVFQPWIAGNGPTFDCCHNFNAPVRYKVFDATGAVVRDVDEVVATKDSVLKQFQMLGGFLRDGSRSLVFVPARWFDRRASNYTKYILDITVLPCATGLKRNDTPSFGNAYPDGGCYPTSNFPK